MILKKLHRLAYQSRILIDGISNDTNVIECRCEEPECFWTEYYSTCIRLLYEEGWLPSDEENISFYTLSRANTSSLPLDLALQKILATACAYAGMDSMTGVPPRQIWVTFVSCIAAALGHRPIICLFPEEKEKRLFIQLSHGDSAVWQKAVDTMLRGFGINVAVQCFPAPRANLSEVLMHNLSDAEAFYLHTDRGWTEKFIKNLGDDVSRDALDNFLRQRFWAKVFWGTDAYYTLNPPIASAPWRRERFDRLLRETWRPQFDSSGRQLFEPFFQLHTVVWEQYSVPGRIEAKPAHIVLDVGSGTGDTCVYFSQKVGDSGRVYAFEPLEANLSCMKKRLSQYFLTNIIIIPFALSDFEKDMYFQIDDRYSTSVSLTEKKLNTQSVRCSTIDIFCNNEHINVDFIKADIEGAELDMLKGAKETLQRDKPVCALALYHKQEDFRSLPQFLENCCSNYTFYIRCDAEPMLFAVVE